MATHTANIRSTAPDGQPGLTPGAAVRRRGRPALMGQSEVLARIRQLAERKAGLFRVHQDHADLYARARRQFGSWAAAVAAAGLDYGAIVDHARRRSSSARRRRRRRVGRLERIPAILLTLR